MTETNEAFASEVIARLNELVYAKTNDGTVEPMVSPDETFTLREMQELYGEIRDKAYNSYVVIDGVNYSTDWGYGSDGIMYFLEMLERRHGATVAAEAERRMQSVGETCEFIIEDNMNESEGMGDVWFRCTSCDMKFDYYADDWLMKQNYCPNCGKKVTYGE